jgi:hypothetical protein
VGTQAARRYSEKNGYQTIEMLPGGAWLDGLAKKRDTDGNPVGPGLFNVLGPTNARKVWNEASKRYAASATGRIHLTLKNASPISTFKTVELPELLKNGNVIW